MIACLTAYMQQGASVLPDTLKRTTFDLAMTDRSTDLVLGQHLPVVNKLRHMVLNVCPQVVHVIMTPDVPYSTRPAVAANGESRRLSQPIS